MVRNHHIGASASTLRDCQPSREDRALTQRLVEAGKLQYNDSSLWILLPLSPNRTCKFPCIRLSIRKLIAGALWIDDTFDTAFPGLAYGVMSDLSCGALGVAYYFRCVHISDMRSDPVF